MAQYGHNGEMRSNAGDLAAERTSCGAIDTDEALERAGHVAY